MSLLTLLNFSLIHQPRLLNEARMSDNLLAVASGRRISEIIDILSTLYACARGVYVNPLIHERTCPIEFDNNLFRPFL